MAGAANGRDFEQAAEIEQAAANDILPARFELFGNDKKALKTNEVGRQTQGKSTCVKNLLWLSWFYIVFDGLL